MENINDKQNHIVDTNKMVSSVEWLSNQAYILFEQYSEGKFDRITLNKLMFEATDKAKEMHKEEIIQAWKKGDGQFDKVSNKMSLEYYEKTYGGNNE
jgi:hypothetical protein